MSTATIERPRLRGYALPLRPVEALADLVARLRDAAGHAERVYLQRELLRIADELVAIRRAVMDNPGPPAGEAQESRSRNPDYGRNATAREKNPQPGMRRCSMCRSVLPVDMFTVTDSATGKRRADCKVCYNARQRTRYVRAGYKVVTVEVLDGDPCLGHPCPECGHPFEVGQHVQGDNVRHERCPA